MYPLPIPSIDTATDPIGSPTDLGERWRALMGELSFGERLLRITFVGPDRCFLKTLVDVEIGSAPHRRILDDLMGALRDVLNDMPTGTTAALLLTRPGRGDVSRSDRTWAWALTEAAARCDVPIAPVFRANDDAVVLVEPRTSVE